ncbi:hypothetical protein TWF696_003848 [Orbilia brochopaga]|uniref:Uncharacterized protein n=1 Tax=Orbilia brochopaga TaxID=3140254 RepID=A0AAV9V5K1_9PEZI
MQMSAVGQLERGAGRQADRIMLVRHCSTSLHPIIPLYNTALERFQLLHPNMQDWPVGSHGHGPSPTRCKKKPDDREAFHRRPALRNLPVHLERANIHLHQASIYPNDSRNHIVRNIYKYKVPR